MEMEMERSEIAAEGTIKAGLHKTPTTECVPQLFDARRRLSGAALSILHELRDGCGFEGSKRVVSWNDKYRIFSYLYAAVLFQN
ncbi:MAG: hypothetical protein WA354_22420 [Terracidiphilus sp.]